VYQKMLIFLGFSSSVSYKGDPSLFIYLLTSAQGKKDQV